MKAKKILAVLTAATMVMAMSITAFAADGDTTGTGTVDGTGASEGHVEQKHMNVVLPTATEQTFAYTMDPERLIQTTNGGKYAEGTTFPEANEDTGVYFLTGEKTYSNESNELQIINKSSHDIKVDVKVKTTASAGGKDIALATDALAADETSPKLYLAAVVGEGENATNQILSATETPVTKKLAGNPGNYEIVVEENAETDAKEYVYKQKTTGLTDWTALKFKIKGAVSNAAITADTTAPKITVTWSFAEPESTDTNLSTDGVGTYSDEPAATAVASCSYVNGKAFIRLVADANADTANITSIKVDGTDTSDYSVTASGAIGIPVTGTGSHTILIVYDGVTYTATATVE
ncbi:hypothetical protein SAMN02910413_1869 [Pseudobutyrivibrio sp. C4]|uniref:hypothetical protein n=1 Tax=Pseudobutyrivibrio sp. C4 TaxID=1520803 RepID=UPI0008B325D1|nr:hypothetical protein [Pseudobutyrivibrio sp. C4]SET12797.1 hypothetical protein SAMN02910413_1869 [Pseudobutyrivibrio sp. C4]